MQDKITKIIESAKKEIENVELSLNALNVVKNKYIGKKSELSNILSTIRELPNEQKPIVGQLVNKARVEILGYVDEKEEEIKKEILESQIKDQKIDVTVDVKRHKRGSLHPCTLVINEMLDIFTGLGFTIKDGPEIETDFFNFQALNVPKDHPARDMQDTFYITDDLLLRSQTSPVQVRTMLSEKPPIRIVTPGKVYRSDNDATHSPMFQQMEGLAIDKNISLCDLYGTLNEFCKKLFKDDRTKIRFRPSYFPFTEPSVEVDVTCAMCHGEGCHLCKGTGWIEILGAGIVNPVVLDNAGINSREYTGFAFGLGIERIAMIKYQIPDMRILFENDIRFLKQFKREI